MEAALKEWQRAQDAHPSDLNSGERILFLLTDGLPRCTNGCRACDNQKGSRKCDPSYKLRKKTPLPDTCDEEICDGPRQHNLRDKISSLEVRVVILGVGNFEVDKIECLAGMGDGMVEGNKFLISNFTDQEFAKLVDDLESVLCDDDGEKEKKKPGKARAQAVPYNNIIHDLDDNHNNLDDNDYERKITLDVSSWIIYTFGIFLMIFTALHYFLYHCNKCNGQITKAETEKCLSEEDVEDVEDV